MNEQGLYGMTQLINRYNDGDRSAFDELVAVAYDELSKQARQLIRKERPGHLLQTTGLVHEAYIRLAELGKIQWQDRRHFFAAAAGVMRRVLIDLARNQRAEKRGGHRQFVTLYDDCPVPMEDRHEVDVLALDAALSKLSLRDAVSADIVELRYFAGLSIEKTAEVLDISPATVKRKWTFARTLLYKDLYSTVS
ncbi:MAG: sigma-70 family RNA polymerase sigma factor [Gammaproteobacteria bacterium]